MKCRDAELMLGLHIEGDLPDDKVPELLAHLMRCRDCAAELEKLKLSQELVKKIGKVDIPAPLPTNFSHNIKQIIIDGQTQSAKTKQPGFGVLRKRPALAMVGIALVAVIAVFIFKPIPWNHGGDISSRVVELMLNGQGSLSWNEFEREFAGGFEGPVKLDEWQPENMAAVYTVMKKSAAENDSEIYKIIFCGEGRSLAAISRYPWIEQRIKRLAEHAGSADNLYIAVYLMPGSSKLDRQKIETKLIEKFKPYFNRYKGV
jgi:hypothetical protein